jgi:hypothetical protein
MGNGNGQIPLEGGLQINPDARLDIVDIRPDVAAAVHCRCPGGMTFLVTMHKSGTCGRCGTEYVVRALKVTPTGKGEHEIQIAVGAAERSPITAPGVVLPGGFGR